MGYREYKVKLAKKLLKIGFSKTSISRLEGMPSRRTLTNWANERGWPSYQYKSLLLNKDLDKIEEAVQGTKYGLTDVLSVRNKEPLSRSENRDLCPTWVDEYESGKSLNQLAREYDKSRPTIKRWLKAAGVEIRGSDTYNKSKYVTKKDQILSLWFDEFLSQKTIADKIGGNVSTLRKWMKRWDIDTSKSPQQREASSVGDVWIERHLSGLSPEEISEDFRSSATTIREFLRQRDVYKTKNPAGCDLVYIISDGKHHKIGVSTKGSLSSRINKLQAGNPHKLFLVDRRETGKPFVTETKLHRKFASHRMEGEWFDIPFEVKGIDQLLTYEKK